MPTSGKTVIIEDFQESVISRINAPPATPTIGDRHLIGTSPTGTWSGNANKIVEFVGGVWTYTAPSAGMRVWVEADGFKYYYTGTAWLDDRFYTRDLLEALTTTDKLSLAALKETTDLKVFLATEKTKLGNINLGATTDTDAEIVSLLEAVTTKLTADAIQDGTTNKAYTALEKTKLGNINLGATTDTDAEIVSLLEAVPTKLTADAIQDGTTNKVLTATALARIPSVDVTAALLGSSGTPNNTNRYMTVLDNRVPIKQIFNEPASAILGDELITLQTDRDFSVDAGNWTGTDWAVVSERYTKTVQNSHPAVLNAYPPEIGKTYQITIQSQLTGGTGDRHIAISYGGASIAWREGHGAGWTYTFLLKAVSTAYLTITPTTWLGSIDNISIKEVIPSISQQIIYSPLSSEAIHIYPHSPTAIGIGKNCLKHNVAGTNLLAMGQNCLENCNDDGNLGCGINAGQSLVSGVNNLFLGVDAGRKLLLSNNAHIVGNFAGQNLENAAGTYLSGYMAGKSLRNGRDAHFSGNFAGQSLVNPTNVTMIGYNAGGSRTYGLNVCLVGNSAGRSGSGSGTAIGNSAAMSGGGVNFCYVGGSAGLNHTTGNNNCFFGEGCGQKIQSGANLTSCSNSVFIGRDVRPPDNGQTEQIIIGDGAIGNGSNTVTLGNNNITATYLKGTVHNDTLTKQALIEVVQDLAVSTTLAFAAPTNAIVTGIRFRVDDEITLDGGGATWQADLAGGSIETIVTAISPAKNTKPVWSGFVRLTAATNMVITPDVGSITGGTLRAQIRYIPAMIEYDDAV